MRKIIIPNPFWGSDLASIILDLEKLRTRTLTGSVPPYIFFQLKEIFHILETLGSARIEGNNTTLSEYVEKIIEDEASDEASDEIKNLDNAIEFIEKNTDENTSLDRAYISQLHQIITKNLTPPPKGEGSKNAGQLRTHNVKIQKSGHIPPNHLQLQDSFSSFIEFINFQHKEQYQLLMVAIAHHRFEYIHPFDNGNGRMGRLLNYAFLIKMGFQVKNGRLINPSSVFYTNRDRYYDMLAKADSLNDADILEWCEYFLLGLKNEIEKIDSLLDKNYVENNILLPSVKMAVDNEHITTQEYKILVHMISSPEMSIKSEELSFLGDLDSRAKTRIMTKLKDKKMIMPTTKNGRIYTLKFVNNYLLRGVMKTLDKNGFISDFLNRN